MPMLASTPRTGPVKCNWDIAKPSVHLSATAPKEGSERMASPLRLEDYATQGAVILY
jgi:hypothetical protein